jgi:hypothetical protein
VAEIIREVERASFKRCRRAWDLGSRSRQNYEPAIPARVFDFERAVHDALALWYFPGMWEWDRSIVRRVALEGFHKSMRSQRDAYVARAPLTEAHSQEWERRLGDGERLLNRYFDWAPAVDAFSPVRVETDFDVQIPDPSGPGLDLVGPGGPIHFRGRVDALVVDAYDAYWVVDHRVVEGAWESLDQLLLDERGVAACWAWEIFYYGMKIAGTVYNELRLDALEADAEGPASPGGERVGGDVPMAGEPLAGRRRMYLEALKVPEERLATFGDGPFRRTRITRTRAELAACGHRLAQEALEMTSPALVVYPNPSPQHCALCVYREPCIALNMGLDPAPILGSQFVDRGPEEVEEGRLGAVTWSMSRGARPPRLGS